MSKARLVITALLVENQTPTQVAARYGVDRSWVYRLKARYEAEGEAAFEPRSRRPRSSPNATAAPTVELVLALRKQLLDGGRPLRGDAFHYGLRRISSASTNFLSRPCIAIHPASVSSESGNL